MDEYEVELEQADPNGFAVTIPALPGLLVLGASLDEVLEHARASIAWHAHTCASRRLTDRIVLVPRTAQEHAMPVRRLSRADDSRPRASG